MQNKARASLKNFRPRLISRRTLRDSLVRLNPKSLLSNPVMFIVEMTFFVVAAMAIYPPTFYPVASLGLRTYYVEIALILLVTDYFSTLSDSLSDSKVN